MFSVTKRAESNLSTESSVYVWLHNYLIHPLPPVYLELLTQTNSICVNIFTLLKKGMQPDSFREKYVDRRENNEMAIFKICIPY